MTKIGQNSGSIRQITVWLFAVAIVLTYFFALDLPFLGPDEPRYAQVAREMYERGDWVSTTLGGFNWFEKPALLYWFQIVGYGIFGVGEFAARFGPALFGLGTALSLFFVGRNLDRLLASTEADQQRFSFRFLLPLITATSLGILVFSRAASFDVTITFPIAASLAGFLVYDLQEGKPESRRQTGLFFFYFFMGIGLLAKGLIGVVLPAGIVGLYLVVAQRPIGKQLWISAFWGLALMLLTASVWYVPVILRHGWEFVDEFFIQHHFQRYTSNKYRHPGPFWYFWLILPAMTIPWIPFFLGSVFSGVRDAYRRIAGATQAQDSNETTRRARLFAACWIIVPLFFFSLSGSKLPGYILPALPGAVLLTAFTVRSFTGKSHARAVLIELTAFLMLVVVCALLAFALPRFAEEDSVKHMIATAAKKGYGNAKVLSMNNTPHSAEFYAAGRLVRDEDGKQWQFLSPAGIERYLKENGNKHVLVIAPAEKLPILLNNPYFRAELIEKNSELTMVGVTSIPKGEVY
ncbi:MAG: glycosyltransferase family 39 protein [Pyrinomonadaceae bacterium]